MYSFKTKTHKLLPFCNTQQRNNRKFSISKKKHWTKREYKNKYFLTAMYCHPLLTRTKSASSSIMYAMVPTGLKADIFKQNENEKKICKKNLLKNNRLLMNTHWYPGITQVFRDALQINKFSCGYFSHQFSIDFRFSLFFFFFHFSNSPSCSYHLKQSINLMESQIFE